ncbi:MAG: hypothetical protein WA364_09220 [Candidatus Nitrosopolaris sp.]
MEGPNDTSGDFLHWLTHWNSARNDDGWARFVPSEIFNLSDSEPYDKVISELAVKLLTHRSDSTFGIV